jgi:hypothetical protein
MKRTPKKTFISELTELTKKWEKSGKGKEKTFINFITVFNEFFKSRNDAAKKLRKVLVNKPKKEA